MKKGNNKKTKNGRGKATTAVCIVAAIVCIGVIGFLSGYLFAYVL